MKLIASKPPLLKTTSLRIKTELYSKTLVFCFTVFFWTFIFECFCLSGDALMTWPALSWGYPQAFWLFLILPIWFLLSALTARFKKQRLKSSLGKRGFSYLLQDRSERAIAWRWVWRVGTATFLILGHARPQTQQESLEIKNEGIELILAMDVSNSMLAEDTPPNRLSLAKTTLERIIDQATGHRIGLVAFAGTAALMTPMTHDADALRMHLEFLNPHSIGTQGTHYVSALQAAYEAFQRGETTELDDPFVQQMRHVSSSRGHFV